MKIKDEGIVIQRIPYSETSLILTIYLQNSGTQKFLFKGGKKKAALLYPMSLVEIVYYKRPESDLLLVNQIGRTKESHINEFHPIQSSIAFFIADVLKNCLKTDQKDDRLYTYLVEKITQLESDQNLSFFPLFFLAELTIHLGIEPMLDEGSHYLDIPEGRFTNENVYGSKVYQGESVSALNKLFKGEEIHNDSQGLKRELLDLLLHYYGYHVPGFNVDRTLEVLKETLH